MTIGVHQPYEQQPFGMGPRAPQMPVPAHFRPNLIAAALSCAGIIIGSIGPWTSFLASERTGISECGVITLVLGIGAAFALTPLLWRGVTPEVKNHYIGPLVGIAVLIVAVGNAACILQRGTEIAGRIIGPSVGWGLWLVMISGMVLSVTSSTVAHVIRVQASDEFPTMPS
ncbi:hypothetical protein FFI94_014690 [Rhodococcus sp. KBS0724]|uniref:hypothetical protein n=1 Tax=Rhodococcus sp. KBS0724 TaxID=1179674 RepID=UPI00110E242D|nr:hypothetical protein [Rhodococcus sp. KBS0724]TSD47280.1 hypothetical protein FFI94_014690 [Rhodococcus sp. KBS0724]